MTKYDAILTADWHLREDTPVCRTDDYWAAQWKKVMFISNLRFEHKCHLLIAGDIFDKWKPSPNLIRLAIKSIPERTVIIAGQHDLPQHNLDLIGKSGVGVLYETTFHDRVHAPFIADPFHYGQELEPYKDEGPLLRGKGVGTRKVALAHTLCYKGRPPWPGAPAEGNAPRLMEKLKGFDLVVTGDNHTPFTYRHKDGRLLVNPGSIMRMTATQANHKPRVYLWNAKENEVEAVYLPIEEGVVSKEHIESKEQRDERMEAFIQRIELEMPNSGMGILARSEKDGQNSLSFEENLKRFFAKNKTTKGVEEMVWTATEKEKA